VIRYCLVDIEQNMGSVHDGAPAHFICAAENYLLTVNTGRWMGIQGAVSWPSHARRLNTLDFVLLRHLKKLVCSSAVDTAVEPLQQVQNGCTSVSNIPGIFQRVHQSIHRRATILCIHCSLLYQQLQYHVTTI
jgi:hypothetical protein